MAFLGYFRLLYTNKRDKADTHTTKHRPGVYFITTDAFCRKTAQFSLMGILQNMGWSRLEMWGGLYLRSAEARFITKHGVL